MKKYDYNLVIIGAGSVGLVVAYVAAIVKAKVALIEKHKMGGDYLNKILATIHIYPTLTEANKFVAGEWKKKHPPIFILKLLEKFHKLRR